jgi:hypothetical protein
MLLDVKHNGDEMSSAGFRGAISSETCDRLAGQVDAAQDHGARLGEQVADDATAARRHHDCDDDQAQRLDGWRHGAAFQYGTPGPVATERDRPRAPERAFFLT